MFDQPPTGAVLPHSPPAEYSKSLAICVGKPRPHIIDGWNAIDGVDSPSM